MKKNIFKTKKYHMPDGNTNDSIYRIVDNITDCLCLFFFVLLIVAIFLWAFESNDLYEGYISVFAVILIIVFSFICFVKYAFRIHNAKINGVIKYVDGYSEKRAYISENGSEFRLRVFFCWINMFFWLFMGGYLLYKVCSEL